MRPPRWCRLSIPTATPPRRAVVVSEGVAVAAAGSVLRGSLQIGRAMAAAVALVGLLGAELLVLRGARAIWSGFRPGSASRPPVRRRRRGASGTALTTTVLNPLTIALWTIRRQRRGQGRNRPQARTCSSCLAIAACCSSLCRWKCSGTVSGRVRKGRCPAINAGRPRVREPEAGPSRREAGHARCLRAPFRQRAAVRAARSPAARLPREPRLAEGGEVDDRAADEGRGDLERALAGGDRGEDVGVAG